MYLVTGTRPDLLYTMSLLAQFFSGPTEKHIKTSEDLFRYINGTRNFGLFYPYTKTKTIDVHVDADFAGCIDT